MKKYSLILVILLFVAMIGMVWMNPIEAQGTVDLYVNPSAVIDATLQPKDKVIIRPNGDTRSANSGNWTKTNLKLMPDGVGSKSEWDGRILTINPSGNGEYTQWNSSNNFTPNEDGNYTNWDGLYSWWNELDGVYVSTDKPKQNETSNFYPVLIEDDIIDVPKTMPILNVKLTMLAKSNVTTDEQVQMMLALPFRANVSSFNEASGWTGWSRIGLSPWLDRDDYPANYIYTSIGGDRIGNFTFQGVPSWIWENAAPNTRPIPPRAVTLSVKTWRSGDANLDELKIYLYNGTKWSTFYVQPRITSAPGSYLDIDISTFVRTASAFNQTKIAIEKITNGEPDTLYIDHIFLGIGGARYRGLKTALTTDLMSYTSEWAKNPFTGSSWTWLDVVNLQAGVESVQVGGSWAGRLMIDYIYISVITGGLYTHWNDWPTPNGDTNYVYASAGSELQTSALTDHTSESWPISKVRATVFACNPGFSVDGRVVPPSGWTGWTKTGSSPYLDAADWPLNYIYSSTASDRIGNFTFQNVTRGLTWSTVTLRIKTWRSTTVPTLKIYLYNGESYTSFSVTPPVATTGPGSYVDYDVSSILNTETKFNAAKMALERLGASGTVSVDHAYLSISDEKMQLMVVSSGTAYYGAETALAPTYTEYTYEWTTDPATGLAWTWPAIDNLQAGVRSVLVGSWTGEVRVTQLYVKVIEAATYTNWNEATQDGDATYLSATSGGKTQVSSIQNHMIEAWTIKNVQVSVVARTDMPTDAKFKITLGFWTGTSWVYESPLSFAPSSSGYKTYTTRWGAKKPSSFGGTAWTWSDIDNLQAGVTSYQTGLTWTGEVRVTQIYIIVSEAVIPVGSDWTQWDDTSPDGDSTYLSTTTPSTGTGVPVACAQVSQLTNVTSPPPWSPARVRVIVNARVTEAGSDEKVQPIIMFQGSSTKYLPLIGPAEYTMTTSYANYTGDWGRNPVTNLDWTWADINRTEAGVQSILGDDNIWTGEIRVTQIVVEVVGPSFSVEISITNVEQLFGFDITLSYNTAVLSATNVTKGSMCPANAWILGTEINDAVGYARYSITMPIGGINGSGTLATIYFIPDSYGLSDLRFTYVKLTQYPSGEIYPVIHDGYFDNRIPGDVDSDRDVDYDDFIVLAGAYGSSVGQPAYKRNADFNQDGNIDYDDFIALAGNYGKTV